MRMKLFGAAVVMAFFSLIQQANAEIIHFNLPDGVNFLGFQVSQDGFTVTNASGSPVAYQNYIAGGSPQFNADPTGADVKQNFSGFSNTITNDLGKAFNFTSIDLADIFNNLSDGFPPQIFGGNVVFTFNHVSGPADAQTVTIAAVSGLQTFLFNEQDLTSVVFTPTTTQGPALQFQNIGVSAVPEPSTWAMMLIGFAGIGFMAYRRSQKTIAIA